MGIESNFPGGTVNVSGYPSSAGGAQVTSTQTDTLNPKYTLLDGTSIGDGSSGGPVWVETAAGPEVVGIVSTANANGVGFNLLITPSILNQIEAWVARGRRFGDGDCANATDCPGAPAASSTAEIRPTSCGRISMGRPRSGRWTTAPGSAADRSASIRGRAGLTSQPATSMATAIPTSCGRTSTDKPRSGR